MTESEDLDVAFAKIIDMYMRAFNFCMPGKVTAFDRVNQTVSVQPCFQRLYADADDPENMSIIDDVPVQYTGSGNFWVTHDIAVDSYVLLMFSQRSLATWFDQGGVVDPELNHILHESDAIAIPGINPSPGLIPDVETSFPEGFSITDREGKHYIQIVDGKVVINTDVIEVRHGGGSNYVKVEDGKVVVNADLVELAEAGAGDFAVAFDDMKAAFDDLKQHLNDLITAYNAHIHVTTATVGATPTPGVINPTTSTGTPSTADMSGAKVEKVKVP
jgi:hypothetical protein